MKITPAILTDEFLTLQQEVSAVQESTLIEAVHIDIIDGYFVDNLTVTPLDLTVADFDPLKIDFHLLTQEPMDIVYECEAVRDYLPIRRIIGQVEKMSYQKDFLTAVKANGWQAGLGLDVFTPLEAIDEDVWPDLDYLLFLAVEGGFQNQKFHRHIFTKLHELRELPFVPKGLKIIIDGGIHHQNIQEVAETGADELVIGSEIWKTSEPDPILTIENLYNLSQEKRGLRSG